MNKTDQYVWKKISVKEENDVSKNKKSKKKKSSVRHWLVWMIIIIIVLIVIGTVVHKKNMANQAIQEKEITEFPYNIEGTGLTVKSLSQASVPNPDADGSLMDDVACIEIQNDGDKYISNVEIILEMKDGTEFTFKIADMPAGSLVQAFDVNNTVFDGEIACKKVSVEELTKEEGSQLMEDAIEIDVEETIVTLTNISDDTLHRISVVCRCDMDGSYFGGCSYTYDIESIPVGESIDVNASDCYLGQASVVRVYMNH